jgi:hypothetical protein
MDNEIRHDLRMAEFFVEFLARNVPLGVAFLDRLNSPQQAPIPLARAPERFLE